MSQLEGIYRRMEQLQDQISGLDKQMRDVEKKKEPIVRQITSLQKQAAQIQSQQQQNPNNPEASPASSTSGTTGPTGPSANNQGVRESRGYNMTRGLSKNKPIGVLVEFSTKNGYKGKGTKLFESRNQRDMWVHNNRGNIDNIIEFLYYDKHIDEAVECVIDLVKYGNCSLPKALMETSKSFFIDVKDLKENLSSYIAEKKKENLEKVKEDDDPCWKGYEQIGMKKKGGKKVPNCVPKKKG